VSCPHALHDGVYLLGALSPEDRRAYEEHLSGCASCSAALAEMAGLPGLLGRLPADVVEITDPPPPDVLPALLAAVQRERQRRRRRFRIVAAALATAAVLVGGVLIVPAILPEPKRPAAVAFTRVGDVPIAASAALVSQKWGTEVDLRCTYTGTQTWGDSVYTLVATDRFGHDETIATWRVVSNQPVVLVASTALDRTDLAALEVRLPTGRPVLRLRT